ncbi:MAG: glycosyltransferase [Bacteroidetes bacterium]|nr:MAG: glycosyltransferase [Bacteroidota bacterium]
MQPNHRFKKKLNNPQNQKAGAPTPPPATPCLSRHTRQAPAMHTSSSHLPHLCAMAIPRISVIISTYNRQAFIITCLQCLAAQTLSTHLFEVVVIDNHCTDDTAALVKQFLSQHPTLPFRYVFEGQKGVSFGRDRGIHEAQADILVYLDDDAEANPTLLENYLHFFDQHPQAAGAGGRILPKYSEAPEPKWMSKWLNGYVAKVDLGGSTRPFKGRMKYPIGCNMAYRKAFLLQIGGFNTQLTFRGDDKYIYLAIKAINPHIYYLPTALVHHNIPQKRLHIHYLRTLYRKTGNEEKLRVKLTHGSPQVWLKGLEFIVKLGVSIGIWAWYALSGRGLQGRYVALSQWYTLQGFFSRHVFVR